MSITAVFKGDVWTFSAESPGENITSLRVCKPQHTTDMSIKHLQYMTFMSGGAGDGGKVIKRSH